MKSTTRFSLIFLFCLLPPLYPTTAAPPAAPVDWRFGVIESYEAPADADTLGVAWTRVRFHWAETQAGGPQTWTPKVSEAQIDGEIAAGRLIVGLLIGIPDWARDTNRLPRGLALPPDDPGNTWATFVRQVVGRYHGRINHWIIWNEPDIADAGAPGHTWDGDIEAFIQLQRTAYLVAHQANANAVVHLPAFTYYWDPTYPHRFFTALAADPEAAAHDYYFDVLTAHLYFQPDSIYDLLRVFYAAMLSRGIPWKPLWLVETNAPPINDPSWPVANWTLSVTQDEQAAFVPQALASALAAGAERIALYKLKDTADDRAANPEPFGLLRLNGSRRPAFTTYRVAIQQMAGVTAARRERWDEVGQIRLSQPGQTTTVLFARLPVPQQAQVPATADSAVLVDMWNTQRTLTAVDGVFTVDLPPALCTQSIGDYCMIGGTTYYLVQAAGDEAVDEPGQVDATTVTPTMAAATILPVATATISPTATPLPTATPTPFPTTTPAALPPALPAVSPSDDDTSAIGAAPAVPANLSPWFIAAGLLLAIALAIWWVGSVKRET